MVRSGRHGLGNYGDDLRSRNQREEDRKNGVVRKTAMESAMDWATAHKAASAGGLCVAAAGGTVAYKLTRPGVKPMEEIVHACKKCAPITVCVLLGAGLFVGYQSGSGSRVYQYAKQYISSDVDSPKN